MNHADNSFAILFFLKLKFASSNQLLFNYISVLECVFIFGAVQQCFPGAKLPDAFLNTPLAINLLYVQIHKVYSIILGLFCIVFCPAVSVSFLCFELLQHH